MHTLTGGNVSSLDVSYPLTRLLSLSELRLASPYDGFRGSIVDGWMVCVLLLRCRVVFSFIRHQTRAHPFPLLSLPSWSLLPNEEQGSLSSSLERCVSCSIAKDPGKMMDVAGASEAECCRELKRLDLHPIAYWPCKLWVCVLGCNLFCC